MTEQPSQITVFERGPYVQAALICEKALQEKDGVLTLVRIVDRVTHSATGPNAPEKMPTITYPMVIVVMLKSGAAKGTFPIRVDLEPPTMQRQRGPIFTVYLEGEDRGQNLILNLNVPLQEPGLYWFDVVFDERRLSRIPLRVLYTRTTPSQPPSPSPPAEA